MSFLRNVGKHGLLGLCIVIGVTVCSNTRGMPRADTERGATAPAMESMAIECSRGHDIKPGDTCAWTVEGDEVEIHAEMDGCAHVSLRKVGQHNAEPGPRLCPGGADYSKRGLSEVHVGDTVVSSPTDAPLCGMLSISGLSLVFNGTDIRIWPGLDPKQLVVHWNGAHWSVKETPSQEWIDPGRAVEAPACHPGQRLRSNDICRHEGHVAVIGRQGNRVDVWESGKDQPQRWVVDPNGSCHVLASMSARPFASLAFAGLHLVWDGAERTWTVVAP